MDNEVVIKVIKDSKEDIKRILMQLLLKSYIRQLSQKEGLSC